jgi:leucyl-tRNA synthetase
MVNHETYRGANRQWLSPSEVVVTGDGPERRAVHAKTGDPIIIGPVEKMSKSRRNTIDPSDILETYGADTARWFMLSDSPPERDVIWTEAGVEGAHRFVQRVWRLIGETAARLSSPGTLRPTAFGADAIALRKAAHRAVDAVNGDIEGLRFNRAVAHVYEFTNTFSSLAGALAGGDDADRWALREAVDILIQLIGPMMPHLAEECWAFVGHQSLLADQPWPVLESALLVEDTVTIAVQVNGKRRDELTVSRGTSNADVEAAALRLDNVLRAIGDKKVRKVIVVPERIVNVVA